MSGRQLNRWGNCVWCCEMLTPEDEEPTDDLCEHCRKWNDLAQLLIKHRFYAEKKMLKAQKEKNVKASLYWQKRRDLYRDMHHKIIEALDLKKQLKDECYPKNV